MSPKKLSASGMSDFKSKLPPPNISPIANPESVCH